VTQSTLQLDQWQTLITHVHIATMTDGSQSYGEMRDAALAIDSSGKIAWLGAMMQLPKTIPESIDVIDGQGLRGYVLWNVE